MKRISLILTAFAAVLAFSAVAVSSASAGVLFETETGNFPVAISGSTKVVAVLETTKGNKVECSETGVAGELGNMAPEEGTKFAHLALVKILFKGCKNNILGGGNCENKGAETKEIEIESLIAHLGLLHRVVAGKEELHVPALLLLVPAGFKFECTVLGVKGEVKVSGSVIAEIEKPEIGVFKTSVGLNLEKEGTGVQKYKAFLLSLVAEAESLMENQHLTSELLGKTEESSQVGSITMSSGTRNIRLELG